MFKATFDKIRKLRNEEVYGLEFVFDSLLVFCRCFSLSYWIRDPFERPLRAKQRTWIIDFYCCAQLATLLGLLAWSNIRGLNTALSTYILFEIYLSLFNIVFIGKFSAINYAPTSIERVILLMFLNVLQVVAAFAVLYRSWSTPGSSTSEALSQAVRVLGTVEAPAHPRLLVDLQILLDLLLLVIFLASFAGQVGLFRRTPDSKKANGDG
jgi:hypothetical protein